jgi:hypothetical protein
VLAAFVLSACGEDDFANEPRPAAPLDLSGVITEQRVTVSPSDPGAGPILLTISNQTEMSHRVTLEGEGDDGTEISETTGPINPLDTATIQQSLPEGEYSVTANSDGASGTVGGIRPDRLVVGPGRGSASDELQLP